MGHNLSNVHAGTTSYYKLTIQWRQLTMLFNKPHQNAAMRVAMEMGLVEAVLAGSETANELAAVTKCDKSLISK